MVNSSPNKGKTRVHQSQVRHIHTNHLGRIKLNLLLTKGVVAAPTTVFSRWFQNANESDLGHMGNLYYILSGHCDKKI